jgi:ribosomal protein S12 methylthiotransferase
MNQQKERLKVGLANLGCSKNQVDAEVMLGYLAQSGFDFTPDQDQAEIIIINTCGFIEASREESIDTILEMARWKEEGRCRLLIAAGCLAQRYGDELIREIPELDGVVGTGDLPRIGEICSNMMNRRETQRKAWLSPPHYLYDEMTPRIRFGQRHWAYVKVSEGCNKKCSFCSIPSMRGRLKSRTIDSVVEEVRRLADEGVREVNLIAQDMTSYGEDRRERGALAKLLRSLGEIEGIAWYRLFYTYPTTLTDELLETLASESRFCNYVDLPLQHIDDRILGRMNRYGDGALIRGLIKRIRRIIPDVVLRSTFIVGFPGETEEEFQRLYDFVAETGFDRLGVFTFSQEEGTPSFDLPDQLPESVKKRRRDRLLRLQSKITLQKNRRLVGTRQRVLVDGLSQESDLLLEGRMAGQAPEIDGVVYINEGIASPGEFVEVEITDAHPYDLVGRIVGA